MKVKVEGGIAHFGTDMVLQLSEAQASARAFALEDLGGGKYRPRMPVQFKAGEVLGVDSTMPEMPGTLRAVLVEAGKSKAVKPSKTVKPEAGAADEAEPAADAA